MRRLLPGLVAVAALLLALPLRAQTLCVASNGEGIGGTGRSSKGSGEGIGGTGRTIRNGGEGIGGTGVVGTITGFGSICVNGLEIDVEEARVDIDGSSASAADLALGQVVAVETSARANALSAVRISVSTAVAGPLSRVDAAAGRLELVGQRVLVASPGALWDALQRKDLTLAELQSGEFVRVSGLRRSDGVVVATRIERSRADVPRVSGPVELQADGSVRIGALRVNPGAARASLAAGRIVTAAGSISNGALTPTLLRVEPEIPFDGRLARLSLEGFVQNDVAGGRFRLANLEVDASSFDAPSGAAALARDARVRVLGSLSGDAGFVPDAIEVETPDMESIRWTPLPPRPQPEAPRPDGGAPEMRREERRVPAPRAERSERGSETPGERPAQQPPERVEPSRRAERPEPPPRPDRAERPERPERPQRMERPERVERPDPPELPDPVERPELPERVEPPERPEPPEPPERMERPEPMQPPEPMERPEPPEPPAPPERP